MWLSHQHAFCLLFILRNVNKEVELIHTKHFDLSAMDHDLNDFEYGNKKVTYQFIVFSFYVLTSLTRCLTGLRPPPTPHTLSRRTISLFMVSSTSARSNATLKKKTPKNVLHINGRTIFFLEARVNYPI